MSDLNAVYWNDEKILSAAGQSPEAICNLLAEHEQGQPTAIAVYQWVSRCKIPDKWRSRLTFCLLKSGRMSVGDLYRYGSSRRSVIVRGPRAGEPISGRAEA